MFLEGEGVLENLTFVPFPALKVSGNALVIAEGLIAAFGKEAENKRDKIKNRVTRKI